MSKETILCLVINGTIYAKYEINGDMLFLKVLVNIYKDDVVASEEFCAAIISAIHNQPVKRLAYLNVK